MNGDNNLKMNEIEALSKIDERVFHSLLFNKQDDKQDDTSLFNMKSLSKDIPAQSPVSKEPSQPVSKPRPLFVSKSNPYINDKDSVLANLYSASSVESQISLLESILSNFTKREILKEGFFGPYSNLLRILRKNNKNSLLAFLSELSKTGLTKVTGTEVESISIIFFNNKNGCKDSGENNTRPDKNNNQTDKDNIQPLCENNQILNAGGFLFVNKENIRFQKNNTVIIILFKSIVNFAMEDSILNLYATAGRCIKIKIKGNEENIYKRLNAMIKERNNSDVIVDTVIVESKGIGDVKSEAMEKTEDRGNPVTEIQTEDRENLITEIQTEDRGNLVTEILKPDSVLIKTVNGVYETDGFEIEIKEKKNNKIVEDKKIVTFKESLVEDEKIKEYKNNGNLSRFEISNVKLSSPVSKNNGELCSPVSSNESLCSLISNKNNDELSPVSNKSNGELCPLISNKNNEDLSSSVSSNEDLSSHVSKNKPPVSNYNDEELSSPVVVKSKKLKKSNNMRKSDNMKKSKRLKKLKLFKKQSKLFKKPPKFFKKVKVFKGDFQKSINEIYKDKLRLAELVYANMKREAREFKKLKGIQKMSIKKIKIN